MIRSVNSAIQQSIADQFYEILIIDDNSTDSTWELAQKFAFSKSNIRTLKNIRNMGPGFTRNRGIESSTGRYIVFLDADDILSSFALEMFRQKIATKEYDIVFSNIHIVEGPDKHRIIKRFGQQDFIKNTISAKNTFGVFSSTYSKNFLLKNSITFPENTIFEDILFTTKSILLSSNIGFINDALYYWMRRSGSITNSLSEKHVNDAVGAVESAGELIESLKLMKKYQKSWEQLAKSFLAVIYERTLLFSVAPQQTVALLRRRIENSSILHKYALIQPLLANTPTIKDKGALFSKANLQQISKAAEDAVVMFPETDYHVRNYASIALEMAKLGVKTLICDVSNSGFFKFNRYLSEEEFSDLADQLSRTQIASLHRVDAKKHFLRFPQARAYVFAIDWGHLRPVLVDAKLRGIPTIAIYEGISDDFLVEPPDARKTLPYRNVDHLLLPGEYYRHVYQKQNVSVTGLPVINRLLQEKYMFPERPKALINVNFTYRVLEECRDEFVNSAICACAAAEIPFSLTQHPADTGNLAPYQAESVSVYDCLKSSTLLISRFSTCILEALAMGKPVIYHNPHKERFSKFQSDPMGAFRVTTTTEELTVAIGEVLQEIQSGKNFRAAAKEYLRYHTNAFAEHTPEYCAAKALQDIIEADKECFYRRLLTHADRFSMPALAKTQKQNFTTLLKALVRCGTNNVLAVCKDPPLLLRFMKENYFSNKNKTTT